MSSPTRIWSRQRLLLAALALFTAGCGGKGTDPQTPPQGNVAVDAARRTTATVGTAGGTVATTSSAGVTCTLSIPAGALPGEVEIAMAPVISMRDFPLPGDMIAAVSLEPSGLRLLKPAVLTIGTATALSDSQVLVGFSYEGDAASVEPTGAIETGGSIEVLVGHFSGAGAARFDGDEWASQLCERPTLERSVGIQILLCASVDNFIQLITDYLDQIVTPALNGALGLSLTESVAEFLEWYWTCDHFALEYQAPGWLDALDARIAAVDDLVELRLGQAISAEKAALCTSAGGVENLRRIFEYLSLAVAVGLENEPGLGEEAVMEGLCAEVDIEDVSLIDPLPLGSDHSLDARAALKINGQRVDAGLSFLVNGAPNVVCGGGRPLCQGRADGLGGYTTVLRRTSPEPCVVNVTATLLLPLFQIGSVDSDFEGGFALVETPLYGYRLLLRGEGAIEATFPAAVDPGEPSVLAVRVTNWDGFSNPQPVPFAVVSFTADGATVNPPQAVADEHGRAEVSVTAQAGARNVTVTITAAVDGVSIANARVEAAVAGANGATVFVESQYTRIIADALDNCVDTVRDMADSLATGPITLSAAAAGNCQSGGTQASASASLTLTANPGVSADNRSATLTFNSSGNSSMRMTESAIANSAGSTWLSVVFEIQGGAMNFQLDATAAYSGATRAEYSVHIDHGGDNSGDYFWQKSTRDSAPASVLASGRLSPGRVSVDIGYLGGADSNELGTHTGTFGLDVTLTLTPAAETAAVR